jgi:DUF1680 family protein
MKKVIAAIGVAGLGFAALAEIGDVQLKGQLGERLEAMIERHVVGTDVDYITAPFLEKTERRYWWQSEFWGKYMHSAVPYSMYLEGGKGTREELKGKIERGVDRMLSSQEPCGYIGNYPEELRCGEGWDVWGIKYTMMGLLHYYDGERGSEKGKRALESCRRLCDYVIAEIGPNGKRGRELWQTGNWSGYASSSILEPVMWLYKRTKDRKYLDFAAYVVKGMTEPKDGPRLLDMALKGVSVADRNDPGYNMNGEWSYVCKKGRSKAYEMMSCYQGFLEYFEVTGRKDLFEAAVKTGEDIIKEEVNLAGGCASSEAWFHGAGKQHLPYERLQETCVTTTWMRFCEKLLDMTGDSRWADQIERTFYNSYLAAMKADGSEFAGYTPLSGNRWHGQHHCFMHTDCCTANGPRGFLCFLKKLFRVKDGAAEFNFYASALAKGELSDGRKVAFDMYSLYPRSEKARIVSHTENVGMVPLKLRIPAWSTNTVVKLNGKELPGAKGGTYFTLEHEWKLGDVVEIEFAMPVVAHKVSHHVAFTRGPVLLARDSRFGDGDMTEPFRWRDIEDGKFTENFNAVRTPSGEMWMAFSATLPVGTHHENPEAALPTTVNFCDYASAGNRWERDNYYRTWFPVEFGPAD